MSLFDPAFEYDAPQYYDFSLGSPAGAPCASNWFAEQAKGGTVGLTWVYICNVCKLLGRSLAWARCSGSALTGWPVH